MFKAQAHIKRLSYGSISPLVKPSDCSVERTEDDNESENAFHGQPIYCSFSFMESIRLQESWEKSTSEHSEVLNSTLNDQHGVNRSFYDSEEEHNPLLSPIKPGSCHEKAGPFRPEQVFGEECAKEENKVVLEYLSLVHQRIFPANFKCHNGCTFAPGSVFGANCSFGDGCKFGGKCKFGPGSSFGVGCRIGGFCEFGDSCSFSVNCHFVKKCQFGNYCFWGPHCHIGDYCYASEGTFAPSCTFALHVELENCRFSSYFDKDKDNVCKAVL